MPLLEAPEYRHLVLPIAVYWGDGQDASSLLGLPPDDEQEILSESYHHIPEVAAAIRAFFMPARVAASKAEEQRRPVRKRQ